MPPKANLGSRPGYHFRDGAQIQGNGPKRQPIAAVKGNALLLVFAEAVLLDGPGVFARVPDP
jgi:hypothetical protein